MHLSSRNTRIGGTLDVRFNGRDTVTVNPTAAKKGCAVPCRRNKTFERLTWYSIKALHGFRIPHECRK